MTQMVKAKIKGLGQNEFVEPGVWLTEEELDIVLERQFDDNYCDKIVHLGGKYFKPRDFDGVIGEMSLSELAKTGSPLFDSKLIESLAKSGHLKEIADNCPPGYRTYVAKLVESGRYKLEGGEQHDTEGLKKLEDLKSQHKLGGGI